MASQSSLNHVYRTVWNEALGAMVAVAENAPSHAGGGAASGRTGARGRCLLARWIKLGQLSVAIAVGWALVPHAQANPTGGTAILGQATMSTNGNVLTVTTQNGVGTNASAINWQSFSIPVGNTTRIEQPNATSLSINRVISNTPSVLLGTLSSNGKVVLVNQSGIAVGAGAQVDTAGFTASTLAMSDQDAASGRLRFGSANVHESSGALTVQGNIIGRGGDVVLIAPSIELAQTAVVESRGGTVTLAAGRSVEVTGRGLEGITMQVQAPADQAINLGTLKGDAVGIFAGTLKHSGLIQATQASVEGGRVVLKASGDAYVEGSGKIIATSSNGKGGTVSILGNRVALTDQASIDVSGATGGGTVLVGGDYQGKNANVQNASISYIGQDTRIAADATENGNGGKVIVWADDVTRAYGNISARGGARGGNGGFVENSGRRYLDFQGRVDTRAPRGAAGTLLLDPTDITISGGPDAFGGGTFLGGIFSGATGNSTLTWATINGQAGNVELHTSPAGGGSGDININTTGAITGPTTLTLLANNNISIAPSVDIIGGSSDVNLVAGWNNTGFAVTPGVGTISFGALSKLTTTGKVWLNAGSQVTEAVDATITANAMIVTTGSTNPVSLLGPNQVGTISAVTAGGTFEYWGGTAGVNVGSVTISGPGTVNGVTTSNAAITLKGTSSGNVVINADVDGGSGITTIRQLGTGNITVNAGSTVTGYGVLMDTADPASTLVSNGTIAADLGNATLTAPGGITVNGVTSNSGLSLTTTNTAISQSGSNSIVVSGATTASAGTGDIVLTTAGNNFSSISLSGGSVQVKDANAMNVTALTSGANKKVVLVAGGALTLPATAINTGTDDLQLGSGTTLVPGAALSGTNVKLVGPGGVNLGSNVTATGTLDISSSTGDVTQVGGVITATGITTINAGVGDVTLASPTNNFSSISVTTTGAVTLQDADALVLKGLKGSGITLTTGGALTQAAGIVDTTGTFNVTTVGGLTLMNANTIRTVDATNTGSGSFMLKNVGLLDLSVMNSPASGSVKVETSGDLTLINSGIHSGATGTAVELVTTGNFLNINNKDITLTGAGTPRWLIYSTNPASNTVGALLTPTVVFQQYGTSYPGAAAQAAGNGLVYSAVSTPVAAALLGPVTKVFDGTTVATLSSSNYSMGSTTDALFGTSTGVVATSGGTGTYDTPNAGTGKTVTSGGGLADATFAGGKKIYGLNIASTSAAVGTITPAPIVVQTVGATLVGTTSKVYDGTTLAALTPDNFELTGFIGSDSASVNQTVGFYASKNAGTGISVSATLGSGNFIPGGSTLLSNYTLPKSASGNIGAITPKPLTLAPTAASKGFDGTTAATVTGYGLGGFVAGEILTATSRSVNFDTPEVGTGKTVTVDGISLVDGTGLASNYSVASRATTLASITAAAGTPRPNTDSKPTDFVITFLEKFEVAVLAQDPKKDSRVKAAADVVVEGEICRP